jgi:L-alanine-DL-glutamate epimerase-like enolase superfamily enzyme
MTISAAEPATMAEVAGGRFGNWPMLKLKLTGDVGLDAERVRAVRSARPDAWIGVDANQGYTRDALGQLVELLLEARVELLEQPLARGAEQDLDGLARPLPFAADESVCTLAEVERAAGLFDMINIKLDKCGGLTEALAIALRCRELGLKVMVGNMMGSSLSMAPSLVVGQLCDIVDLDGPTFLASDRPGAVVYADGKIGAGLTDWGLLATPWHQISKAD